MKSLNPLDRVREAVIGHVRDTFNDCRRGQEPVARSPHALFPADSVIWRVHGDVTTMSIGGVASLFMQMLHPRVLAGVWDHSNFREDTLGRLQRTARFIAVTTYGERTAAEAAIAKVRRIHDHVQGTMPDGTPYSANDPAALAWVHVTESWCFLAAWQRYGRPLKPAEEDRYFQEAAQINRRLGADPTPVTKAEARLYIEAQRPLLQADERSREVARFLLERPATNPLAAPAQQAVFAAAIDLLPSWAQAMHGLEQPLLAKPLVRAGASGLASTLRWAFS